MTSVFDRTEPSTRRAYDAIISAVKKFGAVRAEEKKTSIHLVAKTAFAGVHPRKSTILLNIRSTAPIKSSRIRKVEKVSANRFHNEMLISATSEVDKEVIGWLRAAYELSVS